MARQTKERILKPLTDGLLMEFATLVNKEILQQTQETQHSKWLIDNFLMRGTLNMVYASAGVGKSLFSLELAHFLAKQTDIAKVIYLDGDNSRASLYERGLKDITKSCGAKLEYYITTSEKKRHSMLHKLKDYNLHNAVVIIDSIRNFIDFDMKDDIKVTRFLQKLQDLRDSGGTIIFLHHQPKQYGEENNKMYKGATAFMDSVDEAWYVAKSFKQQQDSKMLSLDIEPQKHRIDTKGYRADIDNKAHKIFFRQDMLIGLTQKQHITLELAQEVINANPQGIIQSELAKQLVKLANANYYEIVGKNSLWNLLDEFKEKLFCVETITPKGGGIRKLYKPLKASSKKIASKNATANRNIAHKSSIQDSNTPKQDTKKATIKENNTIQKSTYITESKTQNKNKSETKTTNTLNLLQTIIARF